MVSNMIYGLVLPVIEIFVAAYVMRNSHAVAKVVTISCQFTRPRRWPSI